MIILPLLASFAALAFMVWLIQEVKKAPRGNATMMEISDSIQGGAKTFLKREYVYIGVFVVIVATFLTIIGTQNPDIGVNWKTAIAFVIGAIASAGAGWIGMNIATQANSRTTQAALDGGITGALTVAISGGGVMGMGVVGVALLGLCLVYVVFDGDTFVINGYAMGASLVALFARSGGGIFTKAADMGADLVGKVEAGIPEDDPRNAAVIADNVGDNVGDVAGLGSDLMESYVEAMIAAIAISSAGGLIFAGDDQDHARSMMNMIPFMIAAVGIFASIVGVYFIRTYSDKNPQSALMNGTYVAAGLTSLGTLGVVWIFGSSFNEDPNFNQLPGYIEGTFEFSKWGIFISTIIGVASGMGIGYMSERYTSSDYKPTRSIARNSESGPALTVTEGMRVGMESTAIPTIILGLAILGAFEAAGFYGVAMAAFGMLATTGVIVSVDSYGPIADNAGGIAEMAHLDKSVREITDNLDSVGNTTAAIGKGFAIGSAAFAALGLLIAYIKVADVGAADLQNPLVLVGLLFGAMFPYFFSSRLFVAVTNSANAMIQEVRRQFREIPGIMEGKAKPDYNQCVAIATDNAIRGMLLPGGMAILLPPFMGFVFGKECLTGVLVGALISGIMLGIQMANSGGAMDNAKKYIEEGHHGGKNSEAHKAAVVGDTVGDPLKDTVGPSINILIKLMCVISLVIAPLLRGEPAEAGDSGSAAGIAAQVIDADANPTETQDAAGASDSDSGQGAAEAHDGDDSDAGHDEAEATDGGGGDEH